MEFKLGPFPSSEKVGLRAFIQSSARLATEQQVPTGNPPPPLNVRGVSVTIAQNFGFLRPFTFSFSLFPSQTIQPIFIKDTPQYRRLLFFARYLLYHVSYLHPSYPQAFPFPKTAKTMIKCKVIPALPVPPFISSPHFQSHLVSSYRFSS